MWDLNTIASDEQSWYFHDESLEKPPVTVMKTTNHHRGIPTRISMNLKLQIVPMCEKLSDPVVCNKSTFGDMDSEAEAWQGDFVADDCSTSGTLDYSIDSLEERRLITAQEAINRKTAMDRIRKEEALSASKAAQLVVASDELNRLDIHSSHGSTNQQECFFLALGWIGQFIQNLKNL